MQTKKISLLSGYVCLFIGVGAVGDLAAAQQAHATHIGINAGPHLFRGDSSSTLRFAAGADAAYSLTSELEAGIFGRRFFNDSGIAGSIYLLGAEFNFFPPFGSKNIFVGAKVANAHQSGYNTLAYAPSIGADFKIAPDITLGLETDYFHFSETGSEVLSVLGGIKFGF